LSSIFYLVTSFLAQSFHSSFQHAIMKPLFKYNILCGGQLFVKVSKNKVLQEKGEYFLRNSSF
jgi:hypothetical protein